MQEPLIENNDQKMERLTSILLDLGLSDESAARIARLLRRCPTKAEIARWNEIGVMQGDDTICVSEEEMENLALTACLWDLMWSGKLVRVSEEARGRS